MWASACIAVRGLYLCVCVYVGMWFLCLCVHVDLSYSTPNKSAIQVIRLLYNHPGHGENRNRTLYLEEKKQAGFFSMINFDFEQVTTK